MSARYVTPLGCTLLVHEAPPHLGPGVLLILRMEQEGDGREAEVYLDPASQVWLKQALTRDEGLS
jgi:hypothetical protein